jgi:guanylate kinase
MRAPWSTINKIEQIYQKKYIIYIERVQWEEANDTLVHSPQTTKQKVKSRLLRKEKGKYREKIFEKIQG